MSHYNFEDFFSFLDQSPTAWHAVEELKDKLEKSGFERLPLNEKWNLKKGAKYFVTNDASICAFINPVSLPISTRLVASHLDSPALKLKPNPEIRKLNCILMAVEVYGAPLLSSWLNRDLGIAGRVFYEDLKGQTKNALVNLTEYPLMIPQLAIHLDREVNEKGLILNKQEHLNALASLSDGHSKGNYLEALLKEKIKFKKLFSFDLFLYPLQKASWIGYKKEMIASYRIDSLASVHAAIEALTSTKNGPKNIIQMAAFWDHEEVGSNTPHGASSPFVSNVLERILLESGLNREAYLRHLAQSGCISVDLAHGCHPNHAEKHDPQHQPLLGKGVVIKSNAGQRYATNAQSVLAVHQASLEAKIALQQFVSRNDIPCGTTIGPIHAGITGMSTVDIGSPQLSMHSARELMAASDQEALYKLLAKYFSEK